MTKTPEQCHTMAELRIEIDAVDDALVSLLTRRCEYIVRATTLKKVEYLPPKTEDRIAQVLALVRERALESGLDADLANQIWSILIDWGVGYEARVMGVAEDGTSIE